MLKVAPIRITVRLIYSIPSMKMGTSVNTTSYVMADMARKARHALLLRWFFLSFAAS